MQDEAIIENLKAKINTMKWDIGIMKDGPMKDKKLSEVKDLEAELVSISTLNKQERGKYA